MLENKKGSDLLMLHCNQNGENKSKRSMGEM